MLFTIKQHRAVFWNDYSNATDMFVHSTVTNYFMVQCFSHRHDRGLFSHVTTPNHRPTNPQMIFKWNYHLWIGWPVSHYRVAAALCGTVTTGSCGTWKLGFLICCCLALVHSCSLNLSEAEGCEFNHSLCFLSSNPAWHTFFTMLSFSFSLWTYSLINRNTHVLDNVWRFIRHTCFRSTQTSNLSTTCFSHRQWVTANPHVATIPL